MLVDHLNPMTHATGVAAPVVAVAPPTSPETLTAYATFVLAMVTVAAIVAPIVQRHNDSILRRRAALRQLTFLLVVFGRRLNEIADDPRWEPEVLLEGLHTLLATAMSSDLWQALPPTNPVAEAMLALLNAHVSLVLAVQQYRTDNKGPYFVQGMAQKARERIRRAQKALFVHSAQYEVSALRLFPYCLRRIKMAPPDAVAELLKD